MKPVEAEEASAPDPDPVPAANTGPGPSFDCRRASTDVLRLICANPELAHADSALADRYRDALANGQFTPSLRADQRRWLAQRDAAPADFNSLMALYDERLSELASGSDRSEPIYE